MKIKQRPSPRHLKTLVGKEWAVSDWTDISQSRIHDFAECTEDRQWIHVDPEKARLGPLGGTVAHGFLLLSLLPHFLTRSPFAGLNLKMLINYGLNRVRFIHPVMAGSRVRNRAVLKDVSRKGFHRLLLTFENTLEIEGQTKPAMVAEVLALIIF